MATLHTHALLLRARDIGESDRIVQLLTPATGRISVVAKGARRSVKRFGGTLDLFNVMRVQIEQRRPHVLARLEQARLVRAYHGLREHPTRFALACYLLEILTRLAPESGARAEHERLFRFTGRALAWLDAAAPSAATRPLLEFRTLDALGLRPELTRCVRCGARIEPRDGPRVPYPIADGGPLCAACHTRPERRAAQAAYAARTEGATRESSPATRASDVVREGLPDARAARAHWRGARVSQPRWSSTRAALPRARVSQPRWSSTRAALPRARVSQPRWSNTRTAQSQAAQPHARAPAALDADFDASPLFTLHLGTLRALEDSLRVPLHELPRLAFGAREVAEATRLLQRFLRFHVGLELRSEPFLAQLTPHPATGKLPSPGRDRPA